MRIHFARIFWFFLAVLFGALGALCDTMLWTRADSPDQWQMKRMVILSGFLFWVLATGAGLIYCVSLSRNSPESVSLSERPSARLNALCLALPVLALALGLWFQNLTGLAVLLLVPATFVALFLLASEDSPKIKQAALRFLCSVALLWLGMIATLSAMALIR